MVQGCLSGQLSPSHAARELGFGLGCGTEGRCDQEMEGGTSSLLVLTEGELSCGRKRILAMYIEAVPTAVMAKSTRRRLASKIA